MRFDGLDNTSYELVAGMLDLPALLALCVCQRALQRRLLALAPVWRRKRGAILAAAIATKSLAELQIISAVYPLVKWPNLRAIERVLLFEACRAGELWKVRWVADLYEHLWKGRMPAESFSVACVHGQLDIARWLYARYWNAATGYWVSIQDIACKSPPPILEWMMREVIPRSGAAVFFRYMCSWNRFEHVELIARHYGLDATTFVGLADLFRVCDVRGAARVAEALKLTPAIANKIAQKVHASGNIPMAKWLIQFGSGAPVYRPEGLPADLDAMAI